MLDATSLRSGSHDDRIKRSGWWKQLLPVNAEIAARTILCVWAGYYFFTVLLATLSEQISSSELLGPQLLVTIFSIGANWVLYRIVIGFGGGRISRSILIISTLPTLALALVLSYISGAVFGDQGFLPAFPGDGQWSALFKGAIIPYLILALWGAIYLAYSYHRALHVAVENGQKLKELTQESELRALRYQLNPHFIFNALNSVSGLIIDQKNQQAEKLVDDLADYMRVVLNDNDEHMVSVAQEIAQQVRYLQIEQVRFPDRLKFEVTVDKKITDWQIPALIIQPLIENAIKYGVSRSADPVTIKILASGEGTRLKLSVFNTGRMIVGHNEQAGTGTGLKNIRERLSLVYGAAAALTTENGAGGMVAASIVVPKKSLMFQSL